MPAAISPRSIVVVAKDQVSCDLAEEVAILHLESGTYCSLDAVGTRIWNLIQEPRLVNDIRDRLVREYDVERDRCERDLLALLGRLAAEGLIEVTGEAAP